jgi:hypothetical protein
MWTFRASLAPLALAGLCFAAYANAAEDIAFVAEHLPEVAMDNRYAALPLWGDGTTFAAGFTDMGSGTLALRGPMAGIAGTYGFHGLRLKAFAFFDAFKLTSGREHRPLNEPFVPTPLALPAAAEFTGLDGTMRDAGLGLALGRHVDSSWIGGFDWSAGVLYQQVRLRDYRLDYRVLDGADAGASGSIDFSADYSHLTPFVGLGKRYDFGDWRLGPHMQVAMPQRRAMTGRITGPGFDLAGNTADNGAGKHFGDPSVTIGVDVTYLPWSLSIDAGSLATQALFEPHFHQGVDQNWALHLYWTR